jgi:hypothetical protein
VSFGAMVLFAGKGEVCENPGGRKKLQEKTLQFPSFYAIMYENHFAEEPIYE